MSHITMYQKIIYLCNKTIGENEKKTANMWKTLNPEYEVKIYDDTMIRTFLLESYEQLYLDIFDYLKDGPIKADFWRICILYKNGGIYTDIDNVPLIKLDDFIELDIDFATCSSYSKFNYNPNFIISSKENIILKKNIDWYINKYINKEKYDYWNWSIMLSFSQNLHIKNYKKKDGIYYFENGMKIQIIKECRGKHHYDAHNIYNLKRVFNNRCINWDSRLHKFKDT